MDKHYKHLSLDERDRIAEMRREGLSLREVAKGLGRSPSTLSRELSRNATPCYKCYTSHRAHDRAVDRKKLSGQRPRLKESEGTGMIVIDMLSHRVRMMARNQVG